MKESEIVLRAGIGDAGQRLDHYLASSLTDLSRSRAQQLILEADVRVNGKRKKPSYKIKPADRIEVKIPPPAPSQFRPEPIPLDIIYEDEDLMVINKPAGLVVHPGAGVPSGTLANALAHHVQQLSHLSGTTRPGIVHRLDKDTSGLIVVAKSDQVHEKLAAQWQRRVVEKIYIGLVYGQPTPPQGKIDAPIGRHPTQRTKMAVRPQNRGRQALTFYRVTETLPDTALLEIEIKTGRTHQIRVHLSSIHHPIVGDRVYGSGYKTKIKDPTVRLAIDQLDGHLLHAARISFQHPRTGHPLTFQSDLPPQFQRLLGLLRSG